MRLALAGLANSGKSTLFTAFTGHGRTEKNLALLPVTDDRVDRLAAVYKPKKATYAQITYIDPPPPPVKLEDPSTRLPVELRQADGLVEVVRNFDGGFGEPQPRADHLAFSDELVLNDLITVENRLDRIGQDGKRGRKGDPEEIRLLEEARELLSHESTLAARPELTAHPKLRGFGFLSAKPIVLISNNEEDDSSVPDMGEDETPVVIRARIEAELAELPPGERDEFAEELGLEENALHLIIAASYRSMDMITFFTANRNEVRSWSIQRGATALEAAGTVHSDMEKGFIRAEVITCDDLLTMGSEAAVKKAGRMNLVGRDHVIGEGDVLFIRFNV
ncbi:MAG: redox-regulated ATPase YchF [Deltaproteobacteria bacterium]|nr:redox-regulated ATPase YchF [Deltaproteobacteria bacterium]